MKGLGGLAAEEQTLNAATAGGWGFWAVYASANPSDFDFSGSRGSRSHTLGAGLNENTGQGKANWEAEKIDSSVQNIFVYLDVPGVLSVASGRKWTQISELAVQATAAADLDPFI